MFRNKNQVHKLLFNSNNITIVTFNIIFIIILISIIYFLILFKYSKSNRVVRGREGLQLCFLLAFSFEIRGKGS